MEKKKKLKASAYHKQEETPLIINHQLHNAICVDDVIKMASKMGLVFNGSLSELRKRVENVLVSHKHHWESSFP